MNNKRIRWMDALKGILILLVVLGHAIQCAHKELGQEYTADGLWRLIYSFHMPAFMAASGFVAFRGKDKRCATGTAWLAGTWRRFRQLVVPFLIWSIPLFFVKADRSHLWDYLLYPNLSLWFLWALFFITALFSLLEWISCKLEWPDWALNMAVAVLLLGTGAVVPAPKLLGFEYIAWYFVFYAVGHAIHDRNLLFRIPAFLPFALCILWLFLGCFWEVRDLPSILSGIRGIPPVILKLSYRLVTALFAIFAVFSFARRWFAALGAFLDFLVWLGQVSLGIYAVHMVVRYPLATVLHRIFPTLSYRPLTILLFVLLFPISLAIVHLLTKNKLAATLLLGKV